MVFTILSNRMDYLQYELGAEAYETTISQILE